MLESAVSSIADSLDFYTHLRQFDLAAPDTRAALAFARTCRELLLRISAACRCQQGFLAESGSRLPGLTELFDLYRDPQAVESLQRQLDGSLFWATARWFAEIYDPDQPESGSYQVWAGSPGHSRVTLCGPERSDAPPGLRVSPELGVELAHSFAERECIVIGHYDVHGVAMLALTLRTLRSAGVARARGILSFEKTGDIGKLWKRTVPQAIRAVGTNGAVLMIDCPVHSRSPEHSLKAIAVLDQVPGCELVIIDHHGDTLELAPQLSHPQVQIVLTDVLSCALLDPTAVEPQLRQLRLLGAIADKVPEVAVSLPAPLSVQLCQANEAFNGVLLQNSPTPAAAKNENVLPAEPLWEALADGRQVSADLVQELFATHQQARDPGSTPSFARCGAVLFVTEKLTVLGRSWYGLLERLMEEQGTSYAVALRVLDGNRANMLLLTHWQHTQTPPVRVFIPAAYWPRCLGHDAAIWVDVDKAQALPFLEQVAANANQYAGLHCDFSAVGAQLRRNILEASLPAASLAMPVG